jgi:hypothetical protein
MPPWEFMAWIVIPLAVATAIIVAVAIARRAPARGSGGLTRFESYTVSFVGAAAMLTGLLSAVSLVVLTVQGLTANPLRVDDMPYTGSPIPGLEVVENIAGSGYQSAWLDVSGMPDGARWLLVLQETLPGLAALAISIAVAWLAIVIIRERPFTRAIPHAIGVAAIAIMVAGIGSQVAGAFGRAAVTDYLGAREVTGVGAEGASESLGYFALALDLSPIGWAFGLLLVAMAFQIGTRIQRDTDLLV